MTSQYNRYRAADLALPEKALQFGSPLETLYTMAVVPDFPKPNIKTFMLFLLLFERTD